MARLLSVNVGLPRDIEWNGRTVHTGIWKLPVQGRCVARRLGLEGDGQGDLGGHGGEQRAVLAYQIDSYRHWEASLNRKAFGFGQFSENFTIDGMPDREVCIGDVYQIGHAIFEVTQPRVTCYRLGIRMDEPRMPALLTSSGRPGFYLRVLQEGDVGAGDEIIRLRSAKEQMTVEEINALLYSPAHPRDRLERALCIDALSPGWRKSFNTLLGSIEAGATGGNAGLAPAAASNEPGPDDPTLTHHDGLSRSRHGSLRSIAIGHHSIPGTLTAPGESPRAPPKAVTRWVAHFRQPELGQQQLKDPLIFGQCIYVGDVAVLLNRNSYVEQYDRRIEAWLDAGEGCSELSQQCS